MEINNVIKGALSNQINNDITVLFFNNNDDINFRYNYLEGYTSHLNIKSEQFTADWAIKFYYKLILPGVANYKIISFIQLYKCIILLDNFSFDLTRLTFGMNDFSDQYLIEDTWENVCKVAKVLNFQTLEIDENYYIVFNTIRTNFYYFNIFNEKRPYKSFKLNNNQYISLESFDQFDSILKLKLKERSNLYLSISNFKYNNYLDRFNLDTKLKVLSFVLYKQNKVDLFVDIAPNSLLFKNEIDNIFYNFWSKNYKFRDLEFYQNPIKSRQLITISQDFIIDCLLNEIQKAKLGKNFKDIYLTSSTGSGKSLLFQLPAFYLSFLGEITIVITPLISLMKDQVNSILNDRKFSKVCYLNSELNYFERENIINKIHIGEINLIYISPELYISVGIDQIIGARKLSLVIVDEAHLISTWGKDFRVDYWLLGNYLLEQRNSDSSKFIIFCLTATSIIGGINDMIFSDIKVLNLVNPHLFIGNFKRNNIKFSINKYNKFKKSYGKNKINQTVEFLNSYSLHSNKTIAYFPYVKHVKSVSNRLRKDLKHNLFYGSMNVTDKEKSLFEFKFNSTELMLATKAFGMGIDIPNVNGVFHHSPSSTFIDYIQEIGRLARSEELIGTSYIIYDNKDLVYAKSLFYLSSIKNFQLFLVVKKLYSIFRHSNNKLNISFSTDEFSYIFDKESLDQKVLSSILLVNEDYALNYHENLLQVKKSKFNSNFYIKISLSDYYQLLHKYDNCFSLIQESNNFCYIDIDLFNLQNLYLKKYDYNNLVSEFFQCRLFNYLNISYVPQLYLTFSSNNSSSLIYSKLQFYFDLISLSLDSLGTLYFTKNDLQNKLEHHNLNYYISLGLSNYLLNNKSVNYTFLSKDQIPLFFFKIVNEDYLYKILNTDSISKYFKKLLSYFSSLIFDSTSNYSSLFLDFNSINKQYFYDLYYFLNLFDLCNTRILGSSGAIIDLSIIKKDFHIEFFENFNPNYSPSLNKILDNHKFNLRVIDLFFTLSLSDYERWEFIEDFLLGSSYEYLENKYSFLDLEN